MKRPKDWAFWMGVLLRRYWLLVLPGFFVALLSGLVAVLGEQAVFTRLIDLFCVLSWVGIVLYVLTEEV